MSEWFETWFDSPYYPLLYQHRDEKEAQDFIRVLLRHLKLPADARYFDLGCGRGRHSIFLHQLGFDVTGMDLSAESIAEAKQHEQPGLRFFTGDMRQPLPGGPYDCILNLFTSFGYFASDEEHLTVLHQVKQALAPGGVFLMDYLNSGPLIDKLPLSATIEKGDIRFDIHKQFQNGSVVKHITVHDGARHPEFEERVRLFSPQELRSLFEQAGFSIETEWGDYAGTAFDAVASSRFILIAR